MYLTRNIRNKLRQGGKKSRVVRRKSRKSRSGRKSRKSRRIRRSRGGNREEEEELFKTVFDTFMECVKCGRSGASERHKRGAHLETGISLREIEARAAERDAWEGRAAAARAEDKVKEVLLRRAKLLEERAEKLRTMADAKVYEYDRDGNPHPNNPEAGEMRGGGQCNLVELLVELGEAEGEAGEECTALKSAAAEYNSYMKAMSGEPEQKEFNIRFQQYCEMHGRSIKTPPGCASDWKEWLEKFNAKCDGSNDNGWEGAYRRMQRSTERLARRKGQRPAETEAQEVQPTRQEARRARRRK